jgi:hypothetical protein
MKVFDQRARLEATIASGGLRVTVQLMPSRALLLFELAVMATFSFLWIRSWGKTSSVDRVLFVVVLVAAIGGWLEQLFGFSEVIEIDAKQIRIRKERFGWERTKEYPANECSDLKLQDEAGSPHGLEFRFGRWRTIEFGDALSPEQAVEVIAALQDGLPEVAQRLLASVDVSQQVTKLNLG